jgi:hypothetical protein
MVHKTGDMRPFVAVGKTNNANPHAVVSADDPLIAFGAPPGFGGQYPGPGQCCLFYKCTTRLFHNMYALITINWFYDFTGIGDAIQISMKLHKKAKRFGSGL